jgi:hypothetical protein
MIVSAPEITRTTQGVRYSVRVRETRQSLPAMLWFEIPDQFGDYLSDKADAAMLGLLVPAMAAGEPLHLEGRVSKRLLGNLRKDYQELLLKVLPCLQLIPITAQETTEEAYPEAREVITGYSGGLDCFTTLLRPRTEAEPAISTLVHTNVGSHGKGQTGKKVFAQRLARAKRASERLGLPLIPVDSNLAEFYDRKTDFVATTSARHASAVLTLQRGLEAYEYSSTYHRQKQSFEHTMDLSRIDELALPLLATESFRVVPSGSQYQRVEKLLIAAQQPVTYGMLDICMKPWNAGDGINCSDCTKCLRVQLALDVIGKLDCYAEVFDLRKHRRLRDLQIAELLRDDQEIGVEFMDFMLARGFKIPRLSRFYALPAVFPLAKAWHRLRTRLSGA